MNKTKELAVRFSIDKDILMATFLNDKSIDRDLAEIMVGSRKKFAEGNDYKIMMIIPSLRSISKEARDYLSTDDAKEGILASAFVSNSLMAKVILNFFIAMSGNNDFPHKVFTSEEKALQWLKKV